VEERRQRDAAPPRDLRRAPRRMESVADLDEVGLERVEHARPAARRERQPVVERTRDAVTCDRAHAPWREMIALARHQQRVMVGGVRTQPVVLGRQVAAHAAAGR